MVILYILIVLLVVVIILFLSFVIYNSKKEKLSNYDKKLILFVIDMYISYGESINIFPSGDAKNILINKINILRDKINNDKNNKKID